MQTNVMQKLAMALWTPTAQSLAVAQWLRDMTTVTNAKPCSVTIGRTCYSGAHYWQLREHDGKQFTQEAYYLLGALPASYKRSTRTCYRFTKYGTRDWYVVCHMPAERITAEYALYHPHGASFTLMPYDGTPAAPTIDHLEPHVYTRITAHVQE